MFEIIELVGNKLKNVFFSLLGIKPVKEIVVEVVECIAETVVEVSNIVLASILFIKESIKDFKTGNIGELCDYYSYCVQESCPALSQSLFRFNLYRVAM